MSYKSSNTNSLAKCLGAVIQERRKESGRTLKQLAQLAGMPVPKLARIERGTVDPDLLSLNEVCCALGITVQRLFVDAYAREDERIVLRSDRLAEQSRLEKQYREILRLDKEPGRHCMLNMRIDLLIIDEEDFSNLMLPTKTSTTRLPRTSVILIGDGDAPIDAVWPFARIARLKDPSNIGALADECLSELPKGQICRLRRVQAELRARRSSIRSQQRQLSADHDELDERIERFFERNESRLSEMLSDDKFLHKAHITQMIRAIRKYRLNLEKAHKLLQQAQAELEEQCRFERHRTLFLLRTESTRDISQSDQ